MPGVRFPVTEFNFFFFFSHTNARLVRRAAGHHRGIGAIGSVRASQARGTGIETQILHKERLRGIGAIGSVRP